MVKQYLKNTEIRYTFNKSLMRHFTTHRSTLAIVCPITNTDKNHPFHVKLDNRTKTTGAVLCDQARTLDINARNYEFIEKAPEDIFLEVMDIIAGFIEIEENK